MQDTRKEILSYFDTIGLILLSAFLLTFPIIFTTLTTDPFALPKQIMLAVIVIVSLVIFGVRMLVLGKVVLRSSPFDLPVFLFLVVAFVSSILAVNRADSLINFVPLLFSILAYFVIVNTARRSQTLLMLLSSLIIGACIISVLAILSYRKIYLLPYVDTHLRTFTPLGSLLDQAIYLALVLPVAGYIAWPLIAPYVTQGESEHHSKKVNPAQIAFLLAFVIMAAGLGMTVYIMSGINPQFANAKPIILPFETGFQTAFAAISQDTGRVFQSFLFGTGYGTYLTDFTRFKLASYNLNPQLWAFTFFRSSSFVLELLATVGILGVLSYFFIVYRFVKEKTFFLPVILAIVATFLLPFSVILQTLLFVLLGIFVAARSLEQPRRYPDIEFCFVSSKRGFFSAAETGEHEPKIGHSRVLPGLVLLVILALVGVISYFTGRYVLSDVLLRKSLVAASQNNGLATYNNQGDAIAMFPYRDTNYRVFSQTNLALANSLAVSQPQGQQPSAEVQQNILTLIQQSIKAGRSAVTLSPQTALNWNNLSSIYRALIGFGQNADQFAVLTNQEAIRLDGTNPQQFINLGGIYYQLGQWDQAQNQFQVAITLKQDYANAYYNLGHALENKNDLANALRAYQTVKVLVANDPENIKKIDSEIAALQKKIGEQTQAQAANVKPGNEQQQPLGINSSERQLPERKPPVEIPGPTISPTPADEDGAQDKKTNTTPSPKATTPAPQL